MNFPTKEQPKQELPPWEKKDREIQIAQSVNLAVQELSLVIDKIDYNKLGIPAETIKSFAKKYDTILKELKRELK
jgi:hypothetical protein